MKKLPEKEKDIQRAILDHITRMGGVAIKFNNVGIRKLDGSYIPPRQKGIADILACYKGKFIAIEVKSAGKKPTEEQNKFLYEVLEAHGRSCWVDNIDDFLKFFKTL